MAQQLQHIETLQYPCGTEYVGEVSKGTAHGQGYLRMPSGVVCRGEFCNGELHGVASQMMPNGDLYMGEFQHGRRYGSGTFSFAAGLTVRGTWIDGVFWRSCHRQQASPKDY